MNRKMEKNFKYQPVSFSDDDSEEELNRELGPSTSPQGQVSPNKCARITRGVVIFTVLAATAAAITTVILYSSLIFPEGGILQGGAKYNNVTVNINGDNQTLKSANNSDLSEVDNFNGTYTACSI